MFERLREAFIRKNRQLKYSGFKNVEECNGTCPLLKYGIRPMGHCLRVHGEENYPHCRAAFNIEHKSGRVYSVTDVSLYGGSTSSNP